jgi:integrase
MASRTRGKHEGTIGQRKDGRWEAKLDLGWVNGKRRRRCFYGATRAEVAKALSEAIHKQGTGQPIPSGRRTVGQFMHTWLESIKPPVVRPRTWQNYELLTRLHVAPALGAVHLAKLEPQTIQAMLAVKLQEGLAPMTVRHIRTVLRRALNLALKWRQLSYNPASLVELPTVDRHEIKPLTEEEARQLLDAAKESRLEVLLVLALRLGLRRGELVGLRWDDVRFDDRQLAVVRSIQRVTGQPLAPAALKTAGSRRNIALPEEVLKALRTHHTRQLEARLMAGAAWMANGLVFPNSRGKPLEPRAVNTLFKRVAKKAGLPASTRFHDLRHTCATLLLERGADMYQVSRLLGHSSLGITADIYAHVTQGMKRGLVEKMDAILAEA